jgi:hypothetical protein
MGIEEQRFTPAEWGLGCEHPSYETKATLRMITRKTVLVLGAGASMPYGFPLGGGLKKEILDVHNVPAHYSILQALGFDVGAIGEFQRRFFGSRLDSIDLFLKHWPTYGNLGKACIAVCIGRCEAEISQRFLNSSFATEDWYTLLWNSLANVSKDEFDKNQLSIVTFNYDRSLEMFLAFTFAHTYGGSPLDAWQRVRETIRIVHVYGDLGALDDAEERPLDLGVVVDESYVKSAQESIRVIGDRVQAEARDECATLLGDAERICFLGFAYAPENIDAIGAVPIPGGSEGRHICGSAIGLEFGDRHAALSRLGLGDAVAQAPFNRLETLAPGMDCKRTLRNYGVLQG